MRRRDPASYVGPAVLITLAWIPLAARAAPDAPGVVGPATAHELRALVVALRHEAFGERVRRISAALRGTPYASDPLGEGPGATPDPDPTFDLGVVDCTTFVELVMALARSPSVDEARRALQHIRYERGIPGYTRRRHFMMAQWIPAMVELGYVRDVTRDVAPRDVRVATKRLGPDVWSQRRKPEEGPRLASDQVPRGVFSLPIVPIDVAPSVADRIPHGTILNVVRIDFDTQPVRVTHQGIVVHEHGRVLLRHAARGGQRRVVDEPLAEFLGRISRYRRWPVAGVNLLLMLPS